MSLSSEAQPPELQAWREAWTVPAVPREQEMAGQSTPHSGQLESRWRENEHQHQRTALGKEIPRQSRRRPSLVGATSLLTLQGCTDSPPRPALWAARSVGWAVDLLQTHVGKKYHAGGQTWSKGRPRSRASLCACPLTGSCEAQHRPVLPPSPKRRRSELHLLYHILLLQLTLPQLLQQHKPGLLQP